MNAETPDRFDAALRARSRDSIGWTVMRFLSDQLFSFIVFVVLMIAGVQTNDEVITPALTFIATANAISYCGAIPHFCDSDPRTLGVAVRSALDRSAVGLASICRRRPQTHRR